MTFVTYAEKLGYNAGYSLHPMTAPYNTQERAEYIRGWTIGRADIRRKLANYKRKLDSRHAADAYQPCNPVG